MNLEGISQWPSSSLFQTTLLNHINRTEAEIDRADKRSQWGDPD
jgi:hypothetical protein